MYAVIKSGGKQVRVSEGDTVQLERLGEVGSDVELTPVLLVDGGTTLAAADQLSKVAVKGRITGEVKGPKIVGFRYKNKSNVRRRWGHRQTYATVEITSITKG
jgi:large subunit ribosomal protein L21